MALLVTAIHASGRPIRNAVRDVDARNRSAQDGVVRLTRRRRDQTFTPIRFMITHC